MKLAGFTLVELVATLIIVSILAIVAIPRFFDRKTFDAQALYDQTRAILRYAQKSAIAQRHTVCVFFSPNSVTLKINSATCGVSDTDLAGPTGATPYSISSSRATFSPTPANFSFNALGRPAAPPATIQISGLSQTIIVEPETGYVH